MRVQEQLQALSSSVRDTLTDAPALAAAHPSAALGVALALVVLAVGLRVLAARVQRLRTKVRRLVERPIDALTDGELARVSGTVVELEDARRAPLLDRPAVLVETRVERTRGVAGTVSTTTLVESRLVARCTISDQHGLLELPLAKARVFLDDAPRTALPLDGAPARVRDHVKETWGITPAPGLVVVERAIPCGTRVSALGRVRRRDGAVTLERGAVPLVVAVGPPPALTGALTRRAVAYTVLSLLAFTAALVLVAWSRGGSA